MSRRFRQAAFTLVEMLVAMALLSMVIFGLSAAMRAFAQAEQRIDSRAAQIEAMRTLDVFLREILGWVAEIQIPNTPLTPKQSALIGSASETVWIGLMPARYGVGGLHYLRLWLRSDERGSALMLSYAPMRAKLAYPDWSRAQSVELASDISAMTISYKENDKQGWVSQWASEDKVPHFVRLQLRSGDKVWPDYFVRVAQGAANGSGGDDLVIGGGGSPK